VDGIELVMVFFQKLDCVVLMKLVSDVSGLVLDVDTGHMEAGELVATSTAASTTAQIE
jgi:hypothetical protein